MQLLVSLTALLSNLHAELRADGAIAARHSNIIPDAKGDGSKSSLHIFREEALGLKRLLKGRRITQMETHVVTFIVKQRNTEELNRRLYDVSDPLSKNYGNHMSQKEVNDFTSNPDSMVEVVAHLEAAGATIVPQRALGECVSAQAPVGLWERIFDTDFHSYSLHPSDTSEVYRIGSASGAIIRAERYSVPQDLDAHVESIIDIIQPPLSREPMLPSVSTSMPSTKSSSRFSEETRAVPGYTTPALLSSLYFMDDASGDPRVTQAAYQSEGEQFSPADVLYYQTALYLPKIGVNRTVASQVRTSAECGVDSCKMCAESILDLSLMLALARIPTWHSYSDRSYGEYLQDLVNGPEAPPNVINFSYKKDEVNTARSELDLFDLNAQKLGLMGTTIVVASGDDGVMSRRARNAPWECKYTPGHPAGSRFVVSVGSTQVHR